MPLFAAVLVVMTVVAAVIVVIVNEPDAGTGPESVPAAAPSFEPIPESIADSIPEPVTVALSRPIPPDERPGNVAVIAVPSPGQVEAEGRKDWPEAAFSVWVECTDLMSRKDFDQAISRMNEVAARSTDRDVRAVTATCRAAAKVNAGNADDAERDFEEAKRELESLPPRAGLEMSFTIHVAEMTGELAGAAKPSSTEDRSLVNYKVSSLAAQLRREGDALSDGGWDRSTISATGIAMGLSLCAGAGGDGSCQQTALVATAAVPQAFGATMIVAIRAVTSRSGPVNPPAGTTTTDAQVATTEPTTTAVPPTAAATTTTTTTTTTARPTTTTPPTTTSTGPTTTTTTTTRTTTTRTTTTRTTTPTTTTRRTTPATVATTSEVDGGG